MLLLLLLLSIVIIIVITIIVIIMTITIIVVIIAVIKALVNTYSCSVSPTGHGKAVRDVSFNNAGTQFLSASYDRYVKLWDTETGITW